MASAEPPKRIVLVVEDEPLLRMHAIDMLEAAGFSTVEADSADEAVEILTKRTDIRIVFTDVDMPGSMNGLKLAELIRGRWPPIELIITSGHVFPRLDELPERGLFFPKPYDDAKIIAAMRAFPS